MKSFVLLCIDLEIDQGEVIEVGYCEVNLKTNAISKKRCSFIIKPSFNELSSHFHSLTGITSKNLSNGLELTKVLEILKNNNGLEGRTILCDSSDELKTLSNEFSKIGYDMKNTAYINVSDMYSIYFEDYKNRSLSYMLNKVGLDFIGRLHRAGDDAYNIARLFLELKSLINKEI